MLELDFQRPLQFVWELDQTPVRHVYRHGRLVVGVGKRVVTEPAFST